jgi:cytochrome P450
VTNIWPEPPFDYRDPDIRANEDDYLARQRQVCPVMRSDEFGGFWALTKFADIAEAAHDHEHFTTTVGPTIPLFGRPYGSKPLTSDPPEHGKYRSILQPFFSPRAIAGMEPIIRELVQEHIAGFVEDGHADLMKVLGEPIPAQALGLLLGLDRRRALEILANNKASQRSGVGEDSGALEQARARALRILTEEIESRRAEPRDDLLSTIVHAEIDGEPVSDDVRYGMVSMLFVAGVDTTVSGITNTLALLCDYDEGYRGELLADRDALDRFIVESLRFDAPVFGLARSVVGGACMRGVEMQDGDRVLLVWPSGNRDPERIPDPDRFDPDRKPGGNVTFGWGRHRCIGDHLAKLEIRVVVEEVLRAIPAFTRASVGPLPRRLDLEHGPSALEVVW